MSLGLSAETLEYRACARRALVQWIRFTLTVFGNVDRQEVEMLFNEALDICNVEMNMAKKPINTKVTKGGKGMKLPTTKNPGKKK